LKWLLDRTRSNFNILFLKYRKYINMFFQTKHRNYSVCAINIISYNVISLQYSAERTYRRIAYAINSVTGLRRTDKTRVRHTRESRSSESVTTVRHAFPSPSRTHNTTSGNQITGPVLQMTFYWSPVTLKSLSPSMYSTCRSLQRSIRNVPLFKAVLEVRFCRLVENLRRFCYHRIHTVKSCLIKLRFDLKK